MNESTHFEESTQQAGQSFPILSIEGLNQRSDRAADIAKHPEIQDAP